jgi:hypothetical protein
VLEQELEQKQEVAVMVPVLVRLYMAKFRFPTMLLMQCSGVKGLNHPTLPSIEERWLGDHCQQQGRPRVC